MQKCLWLSHDPSRTGDEKTSYDVQAFMTLEAFKNRSLIETARYSGVQERRIEAVVAAEDSVGAL